jgi:hypothetical protein
MPTAILRATLFALVALATGSAAFAADATSPTECPPPPTCEDRCRAHAEELYRSCLAGGGDAEGCAARARAALAACVEENCLPDPTCEDRCKARAEEFLRACVEAGGDREACAERARAVLEVCIEEHCVVEPTCEERCKTRAEELYRTCVAGGIDPALCGERARAALEACLRENCEPCLCPDVYDPVCGVDGRTYGNPCEARCAGVAVAYPGPCRNTCRCNDDCADGTVCRDGTCQRPCAVACFVADPVCGTDGRTYTCGAADAACHGVEVLHRGVCGQVCRADADCKAGYLCTAPRDCPDACGCASFCQPCACPRVFDPVCGMDGRTYTNACEARCARVGVAYRGACSGVSRYR